MNFAHPLALLLLLLLIPVALLYRLRVRVPSRTVGTGLFWQKALTEEKARWRWQGRRRKVSAAVQTIIVVLIALAAAGPQIPASKRTVLIIDNSATMRATDVQPTRLDEAKATARRLIESLRSCDEMAVVTVSPTPSEIQPLTSDHALLTAAVDSVQAEGELAAIEWAVKLAGEIPLPDKVPPRIVLITDACAKEAHKRADGSGVEVLRVGTAAGNLAITRFTGRRSKADPAKCEVLVEVRNQGNHSAKGSVTIVVLGGKSSPSVPFSIVKDGLWQHVFTLDLPAAARLRARIEPGDAYIFDDTAELDMPAAPAPHRVKLEADEQSGLKEILAANRRVELIQDDGPAKLIHVIDGKTPEQLPTGPALIFSPGACDLWQLGEAVADPAVTRVDDDSPIAAGVWLFDVYLPEARQLQLAESVRAVAKPIFWAGAIPLGYAIDRPQGRVVVIAGDLATSNLGFQAAFPQLIAQALDWLDGQPPWKDEPVRGQGETGSIGLIGPKSHIAPIDPVSTPAAIDLRVPSDIGSEASAVVVRKPWPPLWIIPAVLAAVLLIIEWCLYQRRWTS